MQSQTSIGITSHGQPARPHFLVQAQPQHEPQLQQTPLAISNKEVPRPDTANNGRIFRVELGHQDGKMVC